MVELNENHYDYISTYSGGKLHFKNPQPEEILIEDIAHNLSMICRYNGSVEKMYSVAQHSIAVAAAVLKATGDYEQALAGLLHDASEAYLCDIPQPIKPHLKGYKSMENRITKAINKKFGVKKVSDVVWDIDNRIVANEARLRFKVVPEWVKDFEEVDIEDTWFSVVPSEDAEATFLYVFNDLMSKINEG